jgi:hypothetical protein
MREGLMCSTSFDNLQKATQVGTDQQLRAASELSSAFGRPVAPQELSLWKAGRTSPEPNQGDPI